MPNGLYPEIWTAVDCDSSQLSAVNFAECAELVQQDPSQIDGILLCDKDPTDPTQPATAAPVDLTSLVGWEAVIGNTAGQWKYLTVIGDLPEPEQEERIISKGRKKKGDKTFSINFDVDDTTDENYDFMRYCESSPEKIMYYHDENYIYGPIAVQIVRANAPKARGEDSYDIFSFTAEWDHKHHPPRTTNPFTS